MKRKVLFSAMAACMVLQLTACGGGGGGGGISTASTTDRYAKYQGVWQGQCRAGPQASLNSTFTISGQSIQVVDNYYNTLNCSGSVIAAMTYPTGSFTIHSSQNDYVDQITVQAPAGPVIATGSGVALVTHPDGSQSWQIPLSAGGNYFVKAHEDAVTSHETTQFTSDLKQFTRTFTPRSGQQATQSYTKH